MGSTSQTRAVEYLAASGAVPISVTERGTIQAGGKITSFAARWWISNGMPRAWLRRPAARWARPGPTIAIAIAIATAAMARAAASLRATLAPDAVALERAHDAASRLVAYVARPAAKRPAPGISSGVQIATGGGDGAGRGLYGVRRCDGAAEGRADPDADRQ
jgi:hypothetical protein